MAWTKVIVVKMERSGYVQDLFGGGVDLKIFTIL